MAFQSTVPSVIPAGIPGELAFEGPLRSQPGRLNSADAANNIFGRGLTIIGNAAAQDATNAVVGAGGTGVFAGISMLPKNHPTYGTSAGGIYAPSNVVPNGEIIDCLTMGEIFALVSTTCNIGDNVYFNTTTGILATTAPGVTTLASHTLIAGARIERFPFTGTPPGLVVVKLTDI